MKNKRGGKKGRRGKKFEDSSTKIIEREDDQTYAKVTKILGCGKMELDCYYGEKNIGDGITVQKKIGIVRGSMRKRVWINLNDIVLVGIRDFDNSNVDIMHRYKPGDIKEIKSYIISDDIEGKDVFFDDDADITETTNNDDMPNYSSDEISNM